MNWSTFLMAAIAASMMAAPAAMAESSMAEQQEQGITNDQILLGTVQTLSGEGTPIKGSIDAKAGIDAYIKRVNDSGGVYGRKLKLITYDHGYEMPKAIQLVKDLVEKDKVFALLSPTSTSVIVATRPYINKVGIPEVGPIDGDPRTRVPVNPTIFHTRPSFDYECRELLRTIKKSMKINEVAIFRPNTALGESLRLTYLRIAHEEGMTISAVGEEGITPGDLDNALAAIAAVHPKAIILTGTAPANNRFLKKALEKGIQAEYFANSPSADTQILEGITKIPYVIAGSGFPVMDESYQIIKDYDADIKKIGPNYGTMAFEGYWNTAVLVEGLKRAGKNPTRQKFLAAMDSIHNYNLGGIEVFFSPEDHGGFHRIWLLKITKDSLTPYPTSDAKN